MLLNTHPTKTPLYCKSSTQLPTTQLSCDSAIGLHLLRNTICAQNYDDKQFSILAKGRSAFHLSVLESIFIKTLNPILCRQKNLSTISRCYRINPLFLQSFALTIFPTLYIITHLFALLYILTFSPDECQSKSFEKMSTLLSAIFKFCITKRSFQINLF